MPWKGGQAPAAPRQLEVFAGRSGVLLNWEPPAKATGTGPAAYYAVYRFAEGEPVDVNDPTHLVGVWRGRGTTFTDAQVPATGQYTYVVTALDRLHLESPPSAPASLYYHVPGSWIDFTQVLVRLYRRAKKPKPN
jgi:hypothetical protein